MPHVVRCHLLAVVLLAATLPVAARSPAGGGWREAEAAFSQRRWDDAIRLLERIVAADPNDALARLRLGAALTNARSFASAREQLDKAEKLGVAPGALAYRRAALLAQTGDVDGAFAQLDVALDAGIGPATKPESDPLLEPLRRDARFASFLERYGRIVEPCKHDAHYRELDFWVGTWDVRPRGANPESPASENVITLEYAGCVVQEHWRSLGGGTGSSFNIYDASRRMWFQTWIDSTGERHEYHGNPDEHGNMAFVGEVPGGPGQPERVPTRLTLFRQGADQVRQFSESSTDGGVTWTKNYDLVYTRRKASASSSAAPSLAH